MTGTTGHGEPMDEIDAAILGRIRSMYDEARPVPAELYTRVRFAFDLERAEYEVATIAETMVAGAGTRGKERPHTVTFQAADLNIVVAISGPTAGAYRLDGWLTPPASLRVELRTAGMRIQDMSDDGGRFAFDEVQPGEVRIAVYPTPGSLLDLAGPVITQGLVL